MLSNLDGHQPYNKTDYYIPNCKRPITSHHSYHVTVQYPTVRCPTYTSNTTYLLSFFLYFRPWTECRKHRVIHEMAICFRSVNNKRDVFDKKIQLPNMICLTLLLRNEVTYVNITHILSLIRHLIYQSCKQTRIWEYKFTIITWCQESIDGSDVKNL